MQKYQKTYLKATGFDFNDPSAITDIKSEISGQRADDIHHIKYLMNGVDRQDYPFERLIALTRDEHYKFGDKKQFFDYLLWAHYLFMPTGYLFDDTLFPDSIFDWNNKDMKDTHMNMFHFYGSCVERKYYVEVWENPDHCNIKVFNFDNKLIKEFVGENKLIIFWKSINLPKPVLWK